MFVHLFFDTFLSLSVLLQCFPCLHSVKWENLFGANRIVKEVLWVPVLVVKMGVNLCVCVCECVNGINKCGSLGGKKPPSPTSLINPHLRKP